MQQKRNTIIKKLVAVILTVCMLLSLVPSGLQVIKPVETQAATFKDLNQDVVFLKQAKGSVTCTLVSAAMLLRRAAMLDGNVNWSSITESSLRSTAWGASGLKWDFTYAGIRIYHGTNLGGSKEKLIEMLKSHPEGIVIYKSSSPSHAILVTDYTDGQFYCADPAPGTPSGRIPISKASIKLSDANHYWYVLSPKNLGTSEAKRYEYAMFPGSVLNMSQGAYGQGVKAPNPSHKNFGGQNAYDLLGNKRYCAPFTGTINKVNGDGLNVVALVSNNKVYYADGTLDYMTVYFMHDNNISDLKEGATIKQGTVFYDEGNAGCSAVHVHIYVKRGKHYENSNYKGGGDYDLNKALYLSKNTKIINKCGYSWKTIDKTTTYTVTTNKAKNISNYSATISGKVSPSGSATWGFEIGTNKNKMKSYSNTKSSVDVQKYTGELKAGTTYYYRMWATVNGKKIYGGYKTFTTTKVKPEIPTLSMKQSQRNVAIEGAISTSWSAVNNAQYYIAKLYDNEGNELQSKNVKGTSAAFDGVHTAGTYAVAVTAYNNAGTKGESDKVEVIVHENINVEFVDYDGTKLCEKQSVGYGKDANPPAEPSRKGYTFTGWDKGTTNITEDTTVTAQYTINKYKVTFVDSKGNILKTQDVEYQQAASAPAVTVEDGYKLISWDKDFSSVEEDMTVTASVDWYNRNYLVYTSIDSAIRVVDSENASNEGYDVDVTITNNNISTTRGRVIVALQTAEGKLLTSTESAAFSVKAGTNKQINVFVPYNEPATMVKVYTVSDYSSTIPIASSVSGTIDQSQSMTAWSTQLPPENATNVQTRTEYRYKTKSTTTSYETSLSGWTQDGSKWVKSGSRTIDYVSSWPSGFNKSHSLYTKYNKTPKTASTKSTTKTTVSTSTVGYIYYHWCRNDHVGAINRLISYNQTSTFKGFHAFYKTSAVSYNSSAEAFQLTNTSVCDSTYWWNGVSNLPVKRCTYTNYKKLFNYYQWSEFSDWGTTVKTADDNTVVETRTVYRYVSQDKLVEDNSGQLRTYSGFVDVQHAGKEATLFVYKVDSASDYTTEYLEQKTIGTDGTYEFTFKLREEPTVRTGDFQVVLGIEGTSTGIFLEPIKAPKNVYDVTFYDADGNVVTKQAVTEGEDAVLPDNLDMEREGYTFLNWTESHRNIRENLDIYPNYKLNEYTVVFVDWTAQTVSMEKFAHGDYLILPELGVAEYGKINRWADVNENTVVTKDMIVTSEIVDQTVNVEVLGLEGQVISEQVVVYNTAFELPELKLSEDCMLVEWQAQIDEGTVTTLEDTVVTNSMTVVPVISYYETAKTPVADVETGEYTSAQTIVLTTETTEAAIYYTMDGSNPLTSETKMIYTEPITVAQSCQLQFYATAPNMDNSEVAKELYAINTTGNVQYHIVKVFDNVQSFMDGYYYGGLVTENSALPMEALRNQYEHYTLQGLYMDAEYTMPYEGNGIITDSVILYAKYEPKSYQVTFKDYNGFTVDTQTVTYGAVAVAPDMTREGYVFVGWESDEYLCVESDCVITAKYILESQYATVGLNRIEVTLQEGLQVQLEATVYPENLDDKELLWESDDMSVASVDEEGLVIANGVGTTYITVTVVETGQLAECIVIVTEGEGIIIPPTNEPSTPPSVTPSNPPAGEAVTLGDVNLDGKVELADAQLVLKAALKISSLNESQTKNTDVDNNGKVELADAQKILKVALKIESF